MAFTYKKRPTTVACKKCRGKCVELSTECGMASCDTHMRFRVCVDCGRIDDAETGRAVPRGRRVEGRP